MAITFEQLIKESEAQREIEEEFAGVKGAQFDISNFEQGLDQIRNKFNVIMVHIDEYMKQFRDITKSEKAIVDDLKKESIDFSQDPWYNLYLSSIEREKFLFNVIAYLAVAVDVTQRVISNLESILIDVKKTGFEKAKIENELTILKDIKEQYINTIKEFRELTSHFAKESDLRAIELLKRLGFEEIKNYARTIDSLERKITVLEERISSLEERERNGGGQDSSLVSKTKELLEKVKKGEKKEEEEKSEEEVNEEEKEKKEKKEEKVISDDIAEIIP